MTGMHAARLIGHCRPARSRARHRVRWRDQGMLEGMDGHPCPGRSVNARRSSAAVPPRAHDRRMWSDRADLCGLRALEPSAVSFRDEPETCANYAGQLGCPPHEVPCKRRGAHCQQLRASQRSQTSTTAGASSVPSGRDMRPASSEAVVTLGVAGAKQVPACRDFSACCASPGISAGPGKRTPPPVG